MEHRLLLNGKYKHYTFLQAEADRGYCSWILGTSTLPLSLRLFQYYLKQQHGGVFSVGKHKGRFFDEVFESDPAYTLWAIGVQDASGNLLEYQRYADEVVLDHVGRQRSRICAVLGCLVLVLLYVIVPAVSSECSVLNTQASRSRSPAYKSELRSKVQLDCVMPGDMDTLSLGDCKVCYDLPVKTVFVNCGHIGPALLKEPSFKSDHYLLVIGSGLGPWASEPQLEY